MSKEKYQWTEEDISIMRRIDSGLGTCMGAVGGYEVGKELTALVKGPKPNIVVKSAIYCGTIPVMAYAGKRLGEFLSDGTKSMYQR